VGGMHATVLIRDGVMLVRTGLADDPRESVVALDTSPAIPWTADVKVGQRRSILCR